MPPLDTVELGRGVEAELHEIRDDALVVNQLAENLPAPAAGGEFPHRAVGNPHAGAESVFLRPPEGRRTHHPFASNWLSRRQPAGETGC